MIDTETKMTTDTPVKLHEVAPQRVTIQCVQCETHVRIYRTEPAMKVGAYRYCPVCGSSDVRVYQSAATDHYEALARDYGVSVPLIKQIFTLWEPSSGVKFGDFIRQLREEAKNDKSAIS